MRTRLSHVAHWSSISRNAAAIAGSSRRSASAMNDNWVGTVIAFDDRQRVRMRLGERGGVAREREADARFDQIEHRRLLIHFRDLDGL